MMPSYIVTCGSCCTANRVPAEMEGKTGRCGTCRAPLLPLYLRPRQLTDAGFDAFAKGYGGPILVEFWAPW